MRLTLLILSSALAVLYGKQNDCVVSNFKFQKDFNFSRYPGLLYHQISTDPNMPTGGVSFTIRLRNDTVASVVESRYPDGTCNGDLMTCRYIGGTAIRLTVIDQPEPVTLTTNIAATDYENYIMFYFCDVLNQVDGTCQRSRFIVETTTPFIRQRDVQLARNVARSLCVDPTAFRFLREGIDCPGVKELRDRHKRRLKKEEFFRRYYSQY